MNRTWQTILAIFAFLACTAFGAVGGCTAGVIGAFAAVEGSHGQIGGRAAQSGNVLFFVLLVGGALVGLALGIFVARQILKPPRNPLDRN